MDTMLDGATPGIRCPHCSAAFSQTIAELKRDPTIACPSCGAVTTFDVGTSEIDGAARSIWHRLLLC